MPPGRLTTTKSGPYGGMVQADDTTTAAPPAVAPVQPTSPTGDQWWTDENGQLQYDPNGRPPSESPGTPATGETTQPSSPSGFTPPGDTSPAQAAQVRAWYQQYLGRDPSDAEITQWLTAHPDLAGVEDAIKGSNEAKTRAGTGTGTGSAGNTGGGGMPDPSNIDAWLDWMAGQQGVDPYLQTPAGKAYYKTQIINSGGLRADNVDYWRNKSTLAQYGGAVGAPHGGAAVASGVAADGGVDPSFTASYEGAGGKPFEAPEGSTLPGPFEYADFQAPENFKGVSAEQLMADPSYQFRLNEAMGALSNSASGRGLTNSGGTLHDLLGLSSQFASQEYGNVWDRQFKDWQAKYDTALNTYATNRGNAADIYGTKDTSAKNVYDRARNEFDASVKDYYDNRDLAFDKLYKTSALGANVTTAQ